MASDTEDDELASLRAAALKSMKPKAQPIQQVISVSGQGVAQKKQWNEFPASADVVSEFQYHPDPMPVPTGFSQGIIASLPHQQPSLPLQGFQRLPSAQTSHWHQPFGNGIGPRHFQPRGQDTGRPYNRAPRRSFGDRGRPPLDRGGRFPRRGYLPERGSRGFFQRPRGPAPGILGVPSEKDLAGGNLIVINPRPAGQSQQAPLLAVEPVRLPPANVNKGSAGSAKPKLELPQDKYHSSQDEKPTIQPDENTEATSKTRDKFSRYDRDSDEEDEDEEEQHSDTEDITQEIDKFLNDSEETLVLDEDAVPENKNSSQRKASISEEVPEIDISDIKDHIDCKSDAKEDSASDADSVDLDALASGDLEDVLDGGLDKVVDSVDLVGEVKANQDTAVNESESLDKLLDSGTEKPTGTSQSTSSSSSSSSSDSSSSSEDEQEDKKVKTECVNSSKSNSLDKTDLGKKAALKASSSERLSDHPSPPPLQTKPPPQDLSDHPSPPPLQTNPPPQDSRRRSKSPHAQTKSLSRSPGKEIVNHEKSRSPSLERTYALETTFSPKKQKLSSRSPSLTRRSHNQSTVSPGPPSTHRPISRSPKHFSPRSPTRISSPSTGYRYSSRSPLYRQRSRSPRGSASRRSISPRGPGRRRSISPRGLGRQRSISPRGLGRQRSISPRGPGRQRSISPRGPGRQRSISPKGHVRRSVSPRGRDRLRGLRRQRSISPKVPVKRRSLSPGRCSISPRRQRPVSPQQHSLSPSRTRNQGASPSSRPPLCGTSSPNRSKYSRRRSTSPRGASVPDRRHYSPRRRRSRSPAGPERDRRRERRVGEGRLRRSSSHSRERHKEPLKVKVVRSPKTSERKGSSGEDETALSKIDLEKLTPQEREKLEARRKKFSSKEISIDPGKKVSLKSIKERSKKKKLKEKDATDLKEPAVKGKKHSKISKTEHGTNNEENVGRELTLSDLEDASGDSDSGRAWKHASAQGLTKPNDRLADLSKRDRGVVHLKFRHNREKARKRSDDVKSLSNRLSKTSDRHHRPDLVSDDESEQDAGLASSRLTSSIVKAQPYKANIPMEKLKIEIQVVPKREKKQKTKPNFSTVYSVPAKRQIVEGDDEEEVVAPVKAKHKKKKHKSESEKLLENDGIVEPLMPARPSVMDRLGKKVDLPPIEKKEKKKKKRKHTDDEREAPVTELDVKIQRIKEQNAAIARRTLEIEQDKKRYG